jgi:hypothetical protein
MSLSPRLVSGFFGGDLFPLLVGRTKGVSWVTGLGRGEQGLAATAASTDEHTMEQVGGDFSKKLVRRRTICNSSPACCLVDRYGYHVPYRTGWAGCCQSQATNGENGKPETGGMGTPPRIAQMSKGGEVWWGALEER